MLDCSLASTNGSKNKSRDQGVLEKEKDAGKISRMLAWIAKGAGERKGCGKDQGILT
jgi:hypothetical protein